MMPVAEARERLLALLSPLPPEQVGLDRALGRVLAEDVVARRTQPPFDASAMDGYAVRAADVATVPTRLRVIGEAPAGRAFAGAVGPGEAVRIFTGAPVPAGADCIVIQEDTDREGDVVVVREGAPAGRYVRRAGLDFRAGETGLSAGRRLTARDVGLAAAMNRPWLPVRRRPIVAILPTGDEVVMPGDPVGPDQIVSSNGVALAAFVRACGGVPVHLPIAGDESHALRSLAAGAAGADLLVSTGGVSVGEHDLVRSALGEGGGLELDFWKIAMRPGKPLLVGRYRGTPTVGLPGNPVSALVCALVFLRPALDRLLGVAAVESAESARLAVPLDANDRRQDYLRATLRRAADGEWEATPYGKQDSSMMSLLAKADCLVVRPPNAPAAKAGDRVEVLRFGGLELL